MSKIVKRTLDFIEVFADHGRPLSLSEIAKLLKLPVSSCYDVLQSLQERGYIYELAPRGGYYPTLKLQHLAGRILAADPIIARAEAKLRALRDGFDESVLLSRVDREQATYLLVLEPSYPLRFLRRVGDTVRHLHATSVGKAILGALDERQRTKLIERLDMVPLTEHTIRTKEALKAEVEESARRGWYLSREESVPTATTVSASFRWASFTFIITIAGPTFRILPKMEPMVASLTEACASLSNPGLRELARNTGGKQSAAVRQKGYSA